MNRYTVKLSTIVTEHGLRALNLSSDYESKYLEVADVNRPALQLAGFYNYFDPRRLQIIGRVETNYLGSLGREERLAAFRALFEKGIAGLIICHGCSPFPECLEAAEALDTCVFITGENTSTIEAGLLASLHRHMAPRITVHGVLVEIYGEGVLITGESGMGKSETALELIKRGHRLIADDAVEIKYLGPKELLGTAPDVIRYYMELRGIGVINVKQLYGVGAVKPDTLLDLVVDLQPWQEGYAYDRLGLTSDSQNILGVTLPKVTIPVRPGRNLAVILELAAMNNRQKKMGYNAAEALAAEVDAIANGDYNG